VSDDEFTLALVIKGGLLLNPPPRDALMAAILDCLQDYPDGLAESIVTIDGREIFFICGPRSGNMIEVHVWQRDEIEAMADRPFVQGRPLFAKK
jgi:hypothetical protein